MKYRIFLLYILATFIALAEAQAQRVVIKGQVTNEKGSPIEVANIKVEGQAAGAIADLKGRYSFECASADTVIVIYSMIGYQTRKRTLPTS